MENKKKILYIEDMEDCYKKTSEALGNDFDIDWKRGYSEAFNAINRYLGQYSAAIFDVNLEYNPNLPNDKQTTQGLDLIKMTKREAERQEINMPILCVSSNGTRYEKLSMEAGADRFLWKKEFWKGRGKEVLEDLIAKV